ncbi:hypothetical protein CASFOL_023650 [Castilleja foliolosa]|uniref:WRKY19-like zinc finger domain-containing protein n=1 Tax=Castilleja foliolosa TaxID=1961234 RepID=A0ABD3CL54_9LAMI
MDGTPDYINYLASQSKVHHTVVSLLELVPKGNKRKCSTLDRPMINVLDESSLILGLGLSSNSCTTMCSGKELEDESSIDLSLSINSRGKKPSSDAVKVPIETSNEFNFKRPILDLQLSLSTGPAESEATTITEGVIIPYQNLVDEGSTSSHWKISPLTPPLEIINPNNPVSARKTRIKTCNFEGCTRGARGATALCIAHGGGRRCQKPGCQKGAEGRTVFCKGHGGGRRCQHLGCTKSAEGRTNYCIGHGGGRRCGHEGCGRAARGKSGLCIRHGGGKRCRVENCTKSAEGVTGLCISHGGGRRCQYPECTKGAQGSTSFCKAHGGGRRCTFLGCRKGAEGSTLFCKGHGGGKRCTSDGCTKSVHGGTLFCVSHGGGKRCAVVECTKSARGRTSYCVRHGGGKRCGFEGCTKSAQGSTNYCKAHGGGKRCSWGIGCDKFARGKSGLCAAHGALVEEKEMVGPSSIPYPVTSNVSSGYVPFMAMENSVACDQLSLPEGRVHGGGLMAMLRGGATFGTRDNNAQEGMG